MSSKLIGYVFLGAAVALAAMVGILKKGLLAPVVTLGDAMGMSCE